MRLLAEMRARNVKKLTFTGEDRMRARRVGHERGGGRCNLVGGLMINGQEHVDVLSRGFPDNCVWIQRFAKGLKCSTVGQLCRQLSYDQPIELLTMHTCFSGAPEVRAAGSQWIRAHIPELLAGKSAYGRAWGHLPGPIPAVLIPLVRGSAGSSGASPQRKKSAAAASA